MNDSSDSQQHHRLAKYLNLEKVNNGAQNVRPREKHFNWALTKDIDLDNALWIFFTWLAKMHHSNV